MARCAGLRRQCRAGRLHSPVVLALVPGIRSLCRGARGPRRDSRELEARRLGLCPVRPRPAAGNGADALFAARRARARHRAPAVALAVFPLSRTGARPGMRRRLPDARKLSWSALVLIAAWWLCQPVLLYAFSWLTGDAVFVPRYLQLALPGAALASTAVAALFIPAGQWRCAAAVLALGVLLFQGQWRQP